MIFEIQGNENQDAHLRFSEVIRQKKFKMRPKFWSYTWWATTKKKTYYFPFYWLVEIGILISAY